MPDLIAPTTRLHLAFLESRNEWGRGVHEDGAGLRPEDDVDTAQGFADWVRMLTEREDRATLLDEGTVHCTYRWIVEDDRFLGAIALRHELNDFLFNTGGHIGYGVRPSARRRGLAGWALGRMLVESRKIGLDRVLITCKPTNIASARTIESAGGVLEDIRGIGENEVRRYWITLA